MKPISLGINGACGRMGRRLVQVAAADPHFRIVAACDAPGHVCAGRDIGMLCGIEPLEVTVAPALPLEPRPDVVIDFSTPRGTMWMLGACVARRIPLVIGTTGHSEAEMEEIRAAAHETPILKATQFSLGLTVLAELVHRAAQLLRDREVDVELMEWNHRGKREAPDQTTERLAQLIQQQMGTHGRQHGRQGRLDERPRHEIGVHSLRAGDNVGTHVVLFAGLGESLELRHQVQSRDCFVRGALAAARFLVERPPGWYELSDVLGT